LAGERSCSNEHAEHRTFIISVCGNDAPNLSSFPLDEAQRYSGKATCEQIVETSPLGGAGAAA
jgi:hypothetical protein